MMATAMAQGNHYDFSAINGGKTLYYLINGSSVTVTYPKANSAGTSYYVGHAKPTGDLVIPSSVTHNGTTYSVTAVDGKAFFYCSGLTSVEMPATVTMIGDSAFLGCSGLMAVTLGEGLGSIGYAAFRGCSHLPSIVLPASLQSINNYAFFSCAMLKKIYSHPMTPPSVTGNTLTADTLVVHCDAMGAYQSTFPWSTRFATVMGFVEELPQVRDTVTARCSYLWQGRLLTESVDSLAVVGVQSWLCDTLHILTLAIEPYVYDTVDTLTLCWSMMPYSYGDTVLETSMESGDYSFLMHSREGCDSTVALHLTVHASEQTQICMVSVADNHNVLMWPKGEEVAEYNIYREGATTGSYTLVATIPYDSLSQWVDETSRPMSRAYRYYITSTDLCGNESEASGIHKTMHLTIDKGQGNNWNLHWSEYEGASYSGYQIYRGHNADDIELIDELPADGIISYTDYGVDFDTVYYQVAIVKDEPCTPAKAASLIFSNIATNGTLGIEEWRDESGEWRVHVENGRIVVENLGNADVPVRLYDMMGRQILHEEINSSFFTLHSSLPAGVYLVRVGGYPARKVVVIR